MNRITVLFCFGTFLATLLVSLTVPAADLEPGAFTFRWENEKCWLRANDAARNDILKEVSAATGIPVTLDTGDDGRVSTTLEGLTLEKLVREVAQGHVFIYRRDKDTGIFTVERILSAGEKGEEGAASAPLLGENELDEARIIAEIMSRAGDVKQSYRKTTTSMSMMGTTMNFTGEMWTDGEKMRMETTLPPADMKQVMIMDGKTMYMYMPQMNMVQFMDMERIRNESGDDFNPGTKFGGAMGGQMGSLKDMDAGGMRYIGKDTLQGETVYIVEGSLGPRPQGMKNMPAFAPESARHWISADDGIARQTVFYSGEGNEMFSQTVEAVDLDPEMDPSLFDFTPPEGAQVIDMTETVLNMRKAMREASAAPGTPSSPAGE